MASKEELERRVKRLEEQVAELLRDRRTQIPPPRDLQPGPSYAPPGPPRYVPPSFSGDCGCSGNTLCGSVICPRGPKIVCSNGSSPRIF